METATATAEKQEPTLGVIRKRRAEEQLREAEMGMLSPPAEQKPHWERPAAPYVGPTAEQQEEAWQHAMLVLELWNSLQGDNKMVRDAIEKVRRYR